MKAKAEKSEFIEELGAMLNENPNFYIADISTLNATDTYNLRKLCFSKNITLQVVKNSLLRKAMEKSDKKLEELYDVLAGPTSIMFAETSNAPAILIKEFRKKSKKPILKAAYVEEECYIGDDQLDALVNIKTKNQLIGEVIGLLQSPIMNVVSSLQSGGNTLAGLLKTLEEKSN